MTVDEQFKRRVEASLAPVVNILQELREELDALKAEEPDPPHEEK